MPSPVVLTPVVSGLPLSSIDTNSNYALIESSFLDVGAYVISGLVPSIGTGLSVNVTLGVAVIGAQTSPAAFVIGSLTPSTTNHLFLLQNGTGTSNTTGTPPAASVKLGTCVTSGSAVTSVAMGRLSGRQQFLQPQALIPGGPAAGITSAGHPDAIDLANWNATDVEGKSCYGSLPSGALTLPADVAYTDVANIFTLNNTFTQTPAATTQHGVVNIGNGGFTGGAGNFGGLAAGNALAINMASGYTGELIGAQVNGVTRFYLDYQGTVVFEGPGPGAIAGTGMINFGNAPFDGSSSGHFVGSSGGTQLALNAASGFAGNLIDWQLFGVSRYSLSASGTGTYPTAPTASANNALVQVGDGGFAGGGTNFTGSANGTYLGVNAAAAATARLIDLQVGGVSKLLLGVGGVLTLANKISTPGIQTGQRTATTGTTLTTQDTTVFCDASGGSFVVTLPTAASGTGQLYTIVKTVSTANTVTLQGNGAETIQTAPGTSANTLVVTSHVIVQSNGTGWFQIA